MLRLRRYRVFLVFALFFLVAFYWFGSSGAAWREAASSAAGAARFKSHGEKKLELDTQPRPAVAFETKSLRVDIPAATQPQVLQTPPPVKALPPQSSAASSVAVESEQKPSIPTPVLPLRHGQPINEGMSDPSLSSGLSSIHWSKLSEQFPVASESLIRLPTGKPKSIPKIQFAFKPETAAAKADRLAKLDIIRGVAKKSWDGYKQFAWLHDELKPKSGKYNDPFAHWGATLVDSLDTLWIMGLKEEFEEAVKAVDQIDFTTTTRPDIPLFETTIRYLGGLVAAYDISGKKHRNLLDKAVELAEVLISAFDTPNRMPETYYYWRPQFASQRHRAGSQVVLAEIGSLSMEFTRLAQLTGEDKYYDAIARITDNLEELQMDTRLPGMWPIYLDISGCGRAQHDSASQTSPRPPPDYLHEGLDKYVQATAPAAIESLSPGGKKYIPLDMPEPVALISDDGPVKEATGVQGAAKGRLQDWQGKPLEEDSRYIVSANNPIKGTTKSTGAGSLKKRQLKADPSEQKPPKCVPQGFKSSASQGTETYTIGGMSDSTYEYLPKQYLLLGGQVEKYRTMYEASTDVVKKHLIFRPMLPENKDILFSGRLSVSSTKDKTKAGDLTGENSHLTCFVGGMLGLGAKIFERPDDLEIAEKLTEGCIWSYGMTPSGIMPEEFEVVPCESATDCAWNQTAYWNALDPRSELRQANYKTGMKAYESKLASASARYAAELGDMTALPTSSRIVASDAQVTPITTVWADTLDRRQLLDLVDDAEIVHMPSVPPDLQQDRESQPTKVQPAHGTVDLSLQPSRTLPQLPVVFSSSPPVSHKDYVQSLIQEERLPPGVTKISKRSYILRPEAIESVWYMYRITGSPHWREAGWRMFEAINKHTSTEYGNSAIDDITKLVPVIEDAMESFWLAETLKYFYLLFSEEDVVNLDEWVLNTEAHPFRRPM